MKMHEMIWATFFYLGTNMWRDKDAPAHVDDKYFPPVSGTIWCDEMHFDVEMFHKITEQLPAMGINTLLLDVGDGVRYDSHPEIGIRGAMTPDELRAEVRRLRALGIEPVPKLNFSAGHDAWLGEYQKMLSTDVYRNVIGDLIHELCDIFEKPKYFHLGMDEETMPAQEKYGYSVVRAKPLWWRDFYHMVDACEKENARPWIWADCIWHHPEEFAAKMPKSVLQSNWHYWALKGEDATKGQNGWGFKTFFDLDRLGFDQVPCTSTCSCQGITRQVMSELSKADLKSIVGFMSVPWAVTIPSEYYYIMNDIYRLSCARAEFGHCFER